MPVVDGDYRKKYKKYNIQIIFEDKFKKDKNFDDKDAVISRALKSIDCFVNQINEQVRERILKIFKAFKKLF